MSSSAAARQSADHHGGIEFRRHMGEVSRQSAVFFAGSMFAAGAGYLFKIYLARALGAEALGIYALGMTLVGFLGVFNTLGLPQSAVRFVAAYFATGKWEQLRAFLVRGFGLLLAANLVLGGILLWMGPWTGLHLYHTAALGGYVWVFAVLMVLSACIAFLGQVLAGYKDVARRTIISNFIGSPVVMVLTPCLIALGMGLMGYMVAQVASATVVIFLMMLSAWKLMPREARSLSPRIPRLEKEVLPFSTIALSVGFLEFLMGQTDKVLIGYYLNAREVGIYSTAAALVVFVPIVLQSVNQIFAPTIADLHARKDHELLGRMFQTLTRWIVALTVPLAAVVIVFARPLMRLFGPEFEAGWPILIIGTMGQLINCGVGSVGYLLLMAGQQRRLIRIQAVMALVMVALSAVLIPRWGIVGAAVGAALTNILTNLWSLRTVHRELGLSPYNRDYLRLPLPLAACLGVLFLLRTTASAWQPAWMLIAVSLILAYSTFLAAALALGLNPEDRELVCAVWSRVRDLFPVLGTPARLRG